MKITSRKMTTKMLQPWHFIFLVISRFVANTANKFTNEHWRENWHYVKYYTGCGKI